MRRVRWASKGWVCSAYPAFSPYTTGKAEPVPLTLNCCITAPVSCFAVLTPTMHTSLPGLGQRSSLVQHSNADLRITRVPGSKGVLQRASGAHHPRHLASGICAASGRDDALRSMQEMRQGVSARLAEHEQELRSGSGPASPAGQTTSSLQEIDSDNYDQVLKDAGDKLVVIDFYTQWCGPCKVMLPMLEQLQEEQPDIRLYKLDCNKKNKQLGQSLGVKVAPTFHLMKNGNKVAEMTGAKIDELKKLIETHK